MIHIDMKKVKRTVTKKFAQAFKKRQEAAGSRGPPHKNELHPDPDSIYYELPVDLDSAVDGNSTVTVNNDESMLKGNSSNKFSTSFNSDNNAKHNAQDKQLPSMKTQGIHIDFEAAKNLSRIDPERQWYRSNKEPILWDDDNVLEIMADELVECDLHESSRPLSTLLVGEFDPKNFLSQVPTEDTSGNTLPPWKRMLMAKQVAEKAYYEAEDTKKKMAEDARYAEMPVWKREIIRKKELERKAQVQE